MDSTPTLTVERAKEVVGDLGKQVEQVGQRVGSQLGAELGKEVRESALLLAALLVVLGVVALLASTALLVD